MGMFTGYKKTASVRSQKRSDLRVSLAFFCARLSALNAKTELKLDSSRIVSTHDGSFPALVENDQVWLVVANRISITDSGVWVVAMYNRAVYTYEISSASSLTIHTNEQGTVYIRYGSGDNNAVYGGAIRLC